jgi:AraC-like DNA-binding protein
VVILSTVRGGHPDAGESVNEGARGVPALPLRGLIAAYDGYRLRGAEPARHLGLPSPFMTVILTLDEPLHVVGHVDRRRPAERYDSLVGGLHASPVVIGHDGAQSGVQLSVSPLASRALFGMPAGELAGADIRADLVLGSVADELREQIATAAGWRERFAILDARLARRLESAQEVAAPVVRAWQLILAGAGATSVSRIAREVGYSERHLTNRFRQEIGLTPKLASRVVRFDRARRLLQARLIAGERTDIAWAAACCGYADHSHLVRDFKVFAELAPSQWLRQEFGNIQDRAAASTYGASHEPNTPSTAGLADAARPRRTRTHTLPRGRSRLSRDGRLR